MHKYFICCVLIVVSCINHSKNNPSVSGGPCTYDSASFSMHVLEITNKVNSGGDSISEIKVRSDIRRDTLILNRIVSHDICPEWTRKAKIEKGSVLTGTVFQRNTGTCTPEIYRFDNADLNRIVH